MTTITLSTARVLDSLPVVDLSEYRARGGMRGLLAARKIEPATVIEEIAASGLRGRGGAWFPTARKWDTVARNASSYGATTVVVNGAEGEPGSFKDRTLLRRNPYRVLEGALIAAFAVGANEIVVAIKASFVTEHDRVQTAIDELIEAEMCDGIKISMFSGTSAYLLGEETALLEAIDGRHPFPRIAPPYRHGIDEIVDSQQDIASQSSSAAGVELAGPTASAVGQPTLVNNVETLANVPAIIANGAAWFREVGTADSPGTVLVTVSGDVDHAGVAEIVCGTPLADAIASIGGAIRNGAQGALAVSGVSNAPLVGDALNTPLTFEAMAAQGSGIGAAGFIVFGSERDRVAIAAAIARFLAVESCGQCLACKRDGLAIAQMLQTRSTESDTRGKNLAESLATVTEGTRCNLATQQQTNGRSVIDLVDAGVPSPGRSELFIASITDIVDGVATYDPDQATKQPDWSHDPVDSGKLPAERLAEHRATDSALG